MNKMLCQRAQAVTPRKPLYQGRAGARGGKSIPRLSPENLFMLSLDGHSYTEPLRSIIALVPISAQLPITDKSQYKESSIETHWQPGVPVFGRHEFKPRLQNEILFKQKQ